MLNQEDIQFQISVSIDLKWHFQQAGLLKSTRFEVSKKKAKALIKRK